MRNLKDLGTINITTSNMTNNLKNNKDLKVFQEVMEVKDREIKNMVIKNEAVQASMHEQDKIINELKNTLRKVTGELEIEKQKHTTEILNKNIKQLKNTLNKKDKEIKQYEG